MSARPGAARGGAPRRRGAALCIALGMIGLAAAPVSGQAKLITADSARIAGWYQLAPHQQVLVVWGPTGGYRLLDFDGAHFLRLEAVGENWYRTTGSGPWGDAAITFERARRMIPPSAY